MRRLASVLAASALLACGVRLRDDVDAGAREPHVELGTGDVSFVAIPPTGGTLELVHGPQGGYHLVVAARLWDVASERVELRYEVEALDGTPLSRTAFVLDATRFVREGDHLARYGDLAILDVAMPEAIAGDDVTVRVVAVGADGATVRDERTVRVVDAL